MDTSSEGSVSSCESVDYAGETEHKVEMMQEAMRGGEAAVLAAVLNGEMGPVTNIHLNAALRLDLVSVVNALVGLPSVDVRGLFFAAFDEACSVLCMEILLAAVEYELPCFMKDFVCRVESVELMRYLLTHPSVIVRSVGTGPWRGRDGRSPLGFKTNVKNNLPLRAAVQRLDYEMISLLVSFRETDASDFYASSKKYEPSAISLAVEMEDKRALRLLVRGLGPDPAQRLGAEFRGRRAEYIDARRAIASTKKLLHAEAEQTRARICKILAERPRAEMESASELVRALEQELGPENLACIFTKSYPPNEFRRRLRIAITDLRTLAAPIETQRTAGA
ncbi:Hypothetical Protein FCC1311_048452 [Hondaea fermentalgiana]|uniref:Uncharacterized protein n=1 Tax=Hondaea fermentalgiana TaxID=2315210 RepID=A0A2R5GL74_9STRA|nr:Hypothetical Protein FCC1311_048452 [Hondaea fermentalgiana]|eukprot:GBG28624.1 Hypothetical Protein FCC1311_048452 [Hondaea fermentalgiana]